MVGTDGIAALEATEAFRRWELQFAPDDRAVATALFRSLHIVSDQALLHALKSHVESILSEHDGSVGLYAARKLDESRYFDDSGAPPSISASAAGSDAKIAYLCKALAGSTPRVLSHPSIEELREHRVRRIVVLDDAIATGNQISRFVLGMHASRTLKSWHSNLKLQYHLVSYAASPWSRHNVLNLLRKTSRGFRRRTPEIHSSYEIVPWSELLSLDQLEAARVLCMKYRSKLHRSARRFWFGYKKNPMPLVFSHRCPNNVPEPHRRALPIGRPGGLRPAHRSFDTVLVSVLARVRQPDADSPSAAKSAVC